MTNLLNIFSNFFQQYFQIIINNQIYKTGKLILLSHKEFYIRFVYIDLKHNKQRYYDIPLPYTFSTNDNMVSLDYTNNTFCDGNNNLLLMLKTINNDCQHHAFYDKKINIKFSRVEF